MFIIQTTQLTRFDV